MLTTFLHNSLVRGALSGFIAAAAVDYHAFLQWKSLDEARAYAWGTAFFHWTQGAVVGAVTAAGLSLT